MVLLEKKPHLAIMVLGVISQPCLDQSRYAETMANGISSNVSHATGLGLRYHNKNPAIAAERNMPPIAIL